MSKIYALILALAMAMGLSINTQARDVELASENDRVIDIPKIEVTYVCTDEDEIEDDSEEYDIYIPEDDVDYENDDPPIEEMVKNNLDPESDLWYDIDSDECPGHIWEDPFPATNDYLNCQWQTACEICGTVINIDTPEWVYDEYGPSEEDGDISEEDETEQIYDEELEEVTDEED